MGERPVELGDFLTGFTIGVLAGAAAALILTPSSGDDLRHLLRATFREASNRARDAAADYSERTAEGRPENNPSPLH
jgi:gas vesicle protein